MSATANTNIDMDVDSSNRTIKGFIKLGRHTTPLIDFNDCTDMEFVNHHIYRWLNNFLPSAFHIEFYSDKKKMFLHLDENVLNCELNPFQFNSTDSSQEITSIMDYLLLYIVEDPLPTHQLNLQSNTLISSGEFDDAFTNTILSGELDDDAVIKTILPGGLDNDTFINTILPGELDDILLPPPSPVSNSSNSVISHNNISKQHAGEEDVDDDIMETNSTIENSFNPQIDSQNSTVSSHEYPIATQPTDENVTQSGRIIFSHDVHPEQKDHYLSNKYRINDGSERKNGNKKSNGGLSYIQGLKTKEEIKKKLQVLPHIQIPRLYLKKININLLLYAVFEERENGMLILYLNVHKGFLLHHQLTRNAKFVNPIKLALNDVTQNGDYKLEIYMLTERNKTAPKKIIIHRLTEEAATQIDRAENIVSTRKKHILPARLLAVLEIDNETCWHTCGLSNFIQPPPKNRQSIALSDTTTVPIALPTPTINLNTVDLSALFQQSEKNLPSICLNAIAAVPLTSPAPKRKRI